MTEGERSNHEFELPTFPHNTKWECVPSFRPPLCGVTDDDNEPRVLPPWAIGFAASPRIQMRDLPHGHGGQKGEPESRLCPEVSVEWQMKFRCQLSASAASKRSAASHAHGAHDQSPDLLSARFSPDSTKVAVACSDASVRVLRVDSSPPQELAAIHSSSMPGTDNRMPSQPVTNLRWHPAKRNVIILTNADGSLQQWDTETHQQLASVQSLGSLFAVDVNADGSRIACAGMQRVVYVFDGHTMAEIAVLEGHASAVFSVAFVPTSPSMLVSAGWDNSVRLWDTSAPERSQLVRTMTGPHVTADSIAVHPFGGTLLSGAWRHDQALQLWDLLSGETTGTPFFNQPLVGALAWHPGGRFAAIASHDQGGDILSLMFCSGTSLEPAKSPLKFAETIHSLHFAPDGASLVAAGPDGKLSLFTIRNW